MTPRLHLFGSPVIDCDGVSMALPFERRSQLVVQLALRRGWVGRAELAALLWPDQPPRLAFSNLRKTLFRLQGQPWGGHLEAQGSALRFAAETDVHAFEQALQQRRPADALALHRGPLLAGFDDDGNEAWTGWLRFERERLHAAWRAAALEHLVGDVDPAAGVGLAARLLEADPLDEAALRAQMTLLARAGQAARAREVYREFAKRLDEELGIAPGPELKALYAAVGQGAATQAAAVMAGASAPAPDGGFIGRAVERRRIAELIARDDVRLLCITGPGGVGKTRLARRALLDLAPGFPEGAVFVALEDVDSAYDLGVRVARDAGAALQGSTPPLEQLAEVFRERSMLLVLDNFEQLGAASARLEELLAACPRLKLIVTSRVRLGLASEQLFPLDGLPCPEPEDHDRLEAFDATRLFVAAAHRVEPALVASAEAAAIVEICRQVDGLPLALELAASFTRALSCEAIAVELRESTELLRTADPSRPARHASIEVVFEQSWRYLAVAERDGLTRLAFFRGGFSAAAARSVAGVPLPVLVALADKSLLRKEGQRSHLHPLVQQLAVERLGDGAARAATASAHADHFLRLLGELRPRIRHAERAAMQEVEIEFENIRAAWRWALAHGPSGELGRAALSLMAFCDHRGRRAEGLALLREAMAGDAVRSAPRLAPVLGSASAHLELRLDHYADAEALALQAIEGARRGGDVAMQLQCATVLGASCARLGRLAESKRWFGRALRLAQELADATHVAATLDNLALVERSLGHLDGSLRLYQQALLQHRAIGDAGGEAMCLNNLGVLHVLREELGPAREMLRAGHELCERHALTSTRCLIENNLAEVAMRVGDHAAALAHARAALEASQTTGQRAVRVEAGQVLVRLALQRGDLASARDELRASLEVALAIGRPPLLAHGVCRFAELLAAQGDEDCARRVMAFALHEPAIVGAERSEAEASMRRWAGAAGAGRGWIGPPLAELAHRIVVETPLAHAPLIALLRAAG